MTVPYPSPKSEAERLDEAANLAFTDGDYDHWRELQARARAERRRERERTAGVTPVWAYARI